ncbi:phosphoribosylglycinamide formyltransferase [Companilactobacillus pabuli]|jgi:phosphoribosylglycinamide formyltransferase-1|uniref:Phosphoribosylglycinamide formyltransferase n=1 Tax=Companilactobacillus pabuli TaxID=2714036 RepID=A0A7L7KWX2_9LACO|nr:phosphoribosylglycinamide formyltransferase [Companilactobacillus pabuli]AKP03724.1 phosphoribosylglycinamide formyltransferase [Companilactobacillus farciminis]AKS52029.1 phosphoribosylglycinamide formyltransferase [Companilactobacillus farciminis]MDG5112938.1 phosphoribosylglycinamide formyltransferase [Companilactobacillus pabuli]QMT84290.1 phosphoribosylglycinamide formyltransferase [Companilactobacillus pabuli]GAQ00593.1 phosphoribosylglycinamide formyltransferase [Companilactobacillus
MRVAIFASGSGSNFEAIAKSDELRNLGLEIEVLVCDQPKAHVLKRAEKYQIPVFVNQLADYPDRSTYEQAIIDKLKPLKIEYILLAGYMKVVTPTLLAAYPNRIINIHPSLLPKFSGLEAIERAFKAGDEVTGVTIHYIDEGVDTGPIIKQCKVVRLRNDTEASLEARIHQTEHQMYRQVILDLLNKNNEVAK